MLNRRCFPVQRVVSLALALSACASEEHSIAEDQTVEKIAGLAPPERGFQLHTRGATIPAGDEQEWCEVSQLPGNPTDAYYVSAFELGNLAHSHHLNVVAAVPESQTEADMKEVGVGEKVNCLSAQLQFGDQTQYVAGSQQPYRKITMPEGVGHKYNGGQWVVFDYHYINTTDKPIEARSAINFHLTDRDAIEKVAHDFAFYNYTIDVPAKASAEFTGECRFDQDVMLSTLTRHTHTWGTDFKVWFANDEGVGDEIWTSYDWQHQIDWPIPGMLVAPRLFRANEGLRFRCAYKNDEDRALRFGTSARDEMCILYGTIWSATDAELEPQNCSIVWIDKDKIGHEAAAEGGFPTPADNDVAICKASPAGNVCEACGCNRCADSINRCAADSECREIYTCYLGCTDQETCGRDC